MNLKLSLVFVCAIVLLSGCAKDKDADSYRRQKVEDDLAALQVADGRYSGVVHSQNDDSVMGAMEVTIRSTTRATAGEGGTAADSEAISIANIRFVSSRTTSITAQNAFFDPDKKDFNAEISMTRPDGQKESLNLKGVIPGESFEGTIEVLNYQGFGGKFSLKKNGPSPESLVPIEQRERGANQPLYSQSFKAVSTFFRDGNVAKENTVPAQLVVVQLSTSPEQDFLNTFIPIKNVQVTINYSDSLKLLHTNAVWDQKNRTLTGSALLRDSTGDVATREIISLACSSRGEFEKLEWSCNHNSSAVGLVAKTETYTGQRNIIDTVGPSTAAMQINFNNGEARFVDHDGRNRKIKVKLRALLPTRSRDVRLFELFSPVKTQTLNLTFSMIFDAGAIPVSYNSAKWDIVNHTLEARESGPGGNGFTTTFSCSNFRFDQSVEAFECQYFATHAADTFYVRFVP